MLVCTLAVGTAGDVLPLLALSLRLRQQNAVSRVTFVTHHAHKEWLEAPLRLGSLEACWINSLPARRWHGSQAGKRRHGDSPLGVASAALGWADEEAHRNACISACEQALNLSLPGREAGRRPLDPARLIIFNLFTLEGFHIAEALGVACVAASPCLVPYAMPAAYERSFRRANPQLYGALLAAGGGEGHAGAARPDRSVSWREVQHWMWPLFTERWGPWRYHRLGLPAVPYSRDQECLPPPPLLLYGLSPTVVPRPGFWPQASVQLCGFWSALETLPPEERQPPPQLATLLSSTCAAPICIDFGSMAALGLVARPARLLRVLAAAAQLLRRPVVLLAAGWATRGSQPSPSGDLLVVLPSRVAHAVLLPRCAALVHHGGSGTVAAALRCGTPQLICPLHFDQHSWAERVAWMGCGGRLPTSVLFPAGLPASPTTRGAALEGRNLAGAGEAAEDDDGEQGEQGHGRQEEERAAAQALAAALLPMLEERGTVRERCREVQQALAGEDGTAVATQHILQYLEQYQQYLQRGRAAEGHPQGGGPGGGPEGQQQWQRQGRGCSSSRGAPTARQGQRQQEQQQEQEEGGYQQAPGHEGKEQQGTAEAPPPASLQQQQPAELLVLPSGLGVSCLSRSEAAFIYAEVWEQQCYLRHGLRVPEGGTVLDVGANIGLFSLYVMLGLRHITGAGQPARGGGEGRGDREAPLGRCTPSEGADAAAAGTPRQQGRPGRVWAFEPVPQIARVLRSNLEAHGLADVVRVVPAALHASPGPLHLTYYPRMPGNSTAKPAEKWAHQRLHMAPAAADRAFLGAEQVECVATTLAAFAAEQQLESIDLLKVDVEGSELEVLEGMDDHCWAITRQVVLEVTDVEGRAVAVQSLLGRHGFEVAVEHGQVACNVMVYGRRTNRGEEELCC